MVRSRRVGGDAFDGPWYSPRLNPGQLGNQDQARAGRSSRNLSIFEVDMAACFKGDKGRIAYGGKGRIAYGGKGRSWPTSYGDWGIGTRQQLVYIHTSEPRRP